MCFTLIIDGLAFSFKLKMIYYFFSIGSLKNVTTLKIDENQLMYLPDSIGG